MAELLLEIRSEEIPARMQKRAGEDLARLMGEALQKAGLEAENIKSFAGPRRLVFVADIPKQSPDIKEERKGPRVGAPEQAIAGFLRGAGLTDISEAEIRSDKKGDYYVAMLEKPGNAASDIIAKTIPEIMARFPWPKSMKSAASNFRWVRPISSILCLLDGKVVEFEVAGIKSGNMTEGHRRMGRGPFVIANFKAYQATLEGKGHVLLAMEARKAEIMKQAEALCEKSGLELVEDAGLLDEVAGLAEWPVVILGDMDAAFLELPAEVIRLSMREHQKYFAVRYPKTGALAAKFIVVANQIAPDGGVEIAKGNARVLSARLEDARFFEAEDAKRSLESRYDELDGVIFHQKLGTMRDKTKRITALAKELAPKVGADPDKAALAAKLAKCDLVTHMVVEFTSLQGKIGRLMYEKEMENGEHGLGGSTAHPTPNPSPSRGGEQEEIPPSSSRGGEQEEIPPSPSKGGVARAGRSSPPSLFLKGRGGTEGGGNFTPNDHADIALAIEEHYKPKGANDSVPTNPVAITVALADKLDTLVGFWAIDEKPTGSKDPYALRRAALGVVRIILENDLRLGLGKWVEDDLLDFILERLKVYLREQNIRHDHIDAVLSMGGDDLVDITNRIKALADFLSTDNGSNLVAGYKRAANILKAEAKKGALPDTEPRAGTAPQEQALFQALQKAEPVIKSALAKEDYAEAMTAISGLRGPIDDFFDKVIVNSDNENERSNRLALLQMITALAGQIADFDKLEG